MSFPVELTPGQRLELSIADMAFGGESVARINDFVIFVPFVIPGEKIVAEVTEVKKKFARAKLVEVTTPSPLRVEPQCPYFAACGGCQYQHVAYAEQLVLKRKQIADLFQRIGHLSGEKVAPVIPCPRPYGYRNRVMIRSQWNRPEQRLNIGFVRWDCGLVEDITQCAIAEPAINEQITHARAHPPPKGGIKLVLRVAPEGWDVPPDSFFQNNFFLLPRLVETVRELVCASGTRHLLDLFCGVGFFALELADVVESFIGVEYDRAAIQAARRNAEARKRANGEFISAMVEDALPNLLRRFTPQATTVLLDPPRKGCDPATLRLLREQGPAQIVYISCHPATMARDLNILCGEGVYELVQAVPLDMFPQTQHVECAASLKRAATDTGR